MQYIRKLKSGKITAYLRVYKMRIGKYGIQTRLFNKDEWEHNINFPIFNSKKAAEKYLDKYYIKLSE